jgi:hypothetical protein
VLGGKQHCQHPGQGAGGEGKRQVPPKICTRRARCNVEGGCCGRGGSSDAVGEKREDVEEEEAGFVNVE